MREKLTALMPDSIIVFMAKILGKTKLTEIERKIQETYIDSFGLQRKGGQSGKIVGIVGLIGSGKSAVAQALAKELLGVIVEGDAVRVRLREAGAGYDRAWKICENIALAMAAKYGKHIVIDADYIATEKRASLNQAAKKAGIDVLYLRTICDFDVMIGRMITASYPEGSFFGGTSTTWQGTADQRGATVKIRELIMRLASHYKMEKTKYPARYRWMSLKFSFVHFVVNTTDEKEWHRKVKKIGKQIRLR